MPHINVLSFDICCKGAAHLPCWMRWSHAKPRHKLLFRDERQLVEFFLCSPLNNLAWLNHAVLGIFLAEITTSGLRRQSRCWNLFHFDVLGLTNAFLGSTKFHFGNRRKAALLVFTNRLCHLLHAGLTIVHFVELYFLKRQIAALMNLFHIKFYLPKLKV